MWIKSCHLKMLGGVFKESNFLPTDHEIATHQETFWKSGFSEVEFASRNAQENSGWLCV